MRSVAIVVVVLGSVILSGCDVGDMVDSNVLSTVREYFPLAEIHKPRPDILAVSIHVGNVSEKFGAKVFQTMLGDNMAQLQMGFGLAKYNTLMVVFDDFSCLWDMRRNAQFACSDGPIQAGVPLRVYPVYENRGTTRMVPMAPLPRCPVCPVCGRGGDDPPARP